ncbi:protein of unknown function [Alicyclobacillus tolerans]|uniref:Rv2525c-like glycoside hydrolase-like domain-containing protein n=1 Tax=Alicyclobacillus tolerans TaxID=90970 RepID=A0A1M6WIR1_9BACL|nr:protein of unknown function [Alicyclobacillus montanus]
MSLTVGTLEVQNAKGCDTDQQITSSNEASCLFGDTPYYFIGRYISNTSYESAEDLQSTELEYLCSQGWYVAVIQHALNSTEELTATLGTEIAKNAINNAISIGVPSGVYLWLDIENYPSSSDAIGFCRAWANEVNLNSPYYPALYYGAPGLDASQIEGLVNSTYFLAGWAGCGAPTGIGESVNQGPCDITMSCNGSYVVSIDEDTLLATSLSGFVVQG